MSKVAVVYWSGTGNTETMANAVVEGRQGEDAAEAEAEAVAEEAVAEEATEEAAE